MGYLKSIGTVIVYISFLLAVITYLPGLPPIAEYSEYSIKLPADVQHQFELKNRLQGVEALFLGEIRGPEYFAAYNGKLYTGVRGGYVVQIEKDRLIPIVRFGQKCDGLWQEEKCGRPLGLKFNDRGELYVADAYYGIFKVDVNTRKYVNIVNSSIPIDGKIPKIVNALDVAKNGDIYWSYSSSEFPLHKGTYVFLANPSGSLVRYNAKTKQNEVLIKNIGFANGVLLSDDESFVIVVDCMNSRILKYHLNGPKVGQQEYFVEGLPGIPDNVHTDGQGGFLVSLVVSIDSEHPAIHQSLIPHPYIRKMLSRLLYSLEAPFNLLEDVYPNYYAERVLHTVFSLDLMPGLNETSIILRMDKTGKILEAVYSTNKKIKNISSAYIYNEYLWLGSPWNNCIMRVPLKRAFPDLTGDKQSSSTKRQRREEPLPTASDTPNIRVETKPTNVKPVIKQKTITKSTPEPTVKVQTTQNLNAAPKVTTSKSTSQSTTTTPKPAAEEVKKNMPKEVKKDTSKETKKDASKEIKKDTSKEIKKDNSNSQTKSDVSNKDNKATIKPENGSAKNTAQVTQSTKSKSVEKKNDPPKK
ncbi:adipocyte plasma membrane-associated protein Hemomucin [Xylocopa sonorina]|uniref:adipocyte plasma membrane-associated protein Hemomucin n=1 Tax=Xylocopa sonorina TaxID=1818115 RepID=UPI00403AFB52